MISRMRARRDGFTIVEAIVTIVLLSVVLLAMAPVLLQAVQRQRTDALQLERTSVLMAQANRLLALPFSQLDAQTDFTVGDPYTLEYAVEIDVTGAPGPEREVKVKIVPSAVIGPDSIQFARTQP
ncbi:MAG TPA: prepilin-type N-terminal cleavage/methylation domain-containing protein [Longimicrobiales bacterium]|nr:prepilin-type N-terminal cleavage/methylation domain-containing protein [Longimicrobiales bacterium]